MDPVHPIAPGPPALPNAGIPPVQRPERVSRERDRPREDQQRRRHRPPPPPRAEGGEDEGGAHIDVLA